MQRILPKSNVPKQWLPTWYAGLTNLGICYANLTMVLMYVLTGLPVDWYNYITVIFSLTVSTVVLMFMSKQVQEQMWQKLNRETRTTFNEEGF